MTDAPNIRYHGLDLIRLVSFFAIAIFHITLIHWSTASIAISERSDLMYGVEVYTRSLAFSGFTVAFLTSLLLGFSRSGVRANLGLFAFLGMGWLLFSSLMNTPWGFLTWDIYPLIILGLLIMGLAEGIGSKLVIIMAGLGVVLLAVPVWQWGEWLFPEFFHQYSALGNVLGIVSCKHQVVEWPLLPWLGLILFGSGCGYGMRAALTKGPPAQFNLSLKEGLVWVPLLGAGTLTWGSYFGIQLGRHFACEAYRQEPMVFWGHFVWVLFAIRLSLDTRVQRWLCRQPWVLWVSSLAISRKFWLAYLTNYLLAHVLSFMVTTIRMETWSPHDRIIEIICFGFLPLTEVVVRGELAVARVCRRRFGRRHCSPQGVSGDPEGQEQPLPS